MPTPVRICPECSTLNPPSSKFCRNCSANVADVLPLDAETLPDDARNRGTVAAPPQPVREPAQEPARVRVRAEPKGTVITGIDIPFMEWVELLVKVSFAAIPAAIIIAAVWLIIGIVIAGISQA